MNNQIAEIILEQIKMQDRFALVAWGSSRFTPIENGVSFQIRTPLYPENTVVSITLNVMDTYDIHIVKDGVDIESTSDVYNDALIQVIDSLIEKDKKEIIFVE